MARFPREIRDATPLLAELEDAVPRQLARKRVLITFPMRDAAFPASSTLPRLRDAFTDVRVVELPQAKHFFAEDTPDEVSAAIAQRFGPPR